MPGPRMFTVGEGDDRIEHWKRPFDALFKELLSSLETAREGRDLPWEEVVPATITKTEQQKELVESLRMAEIEYAHDEVFWALSPGACIESTDWDSGGPMSGIYKRARIPTSERKQAIKTLELVAASLRVYLSNRNAR
jgi:hypothetical protein